MSLDIALHDALQHNLVLIGLPNADTEVLTQKLRSYYASAGKHLAEANIYQPSFYHAHKEPETYTVEKSQRYVRPLSFLIHKGAHACIIRDSHAVMIKGDVRHVLSRGQQVIIVSLNIDNPELHFEDLLEEYRVPHCSASSIMIESFHPPRLSYVSYGDETIADRLF